MHGAETTIRALLSELTEIHDPARLEPSVAFARGLIGRMRPHLGAGVRLGLFVLSFRTVPFSGRTFANAPAYARARVITSCRASVLSPWRDLIALFDILAAIALADTPEAFTARGWDESRYAALQRFYTP